MLKRYFKPNSLTWLASVVPILAGLLILTEPIHQQHDLVVMVTAKFPGASPTELILTGLAGVGLRGVAGEIVETMKRGL